MKPIRGVIHGKTITLADAPAMPDGAKVELSLRPARRRCTVRRKTAGEGLRRAAGALAESWTQEDDRILAQIRRQRDASASRGTPR